MNFFGGISDCSMVSKGILQIIHNQDIDIPILIRVMGEGADEAKMLLAQSPLKIFTDFDDSVHEAIITADRLTKVSVE